MAKPGWGLAFLCSGGTDGRGPDPAHGTDAVPRARTRRMLPQWRIVAGVTELSHLTDLAQTRGVQRAVLHPAYDPRREANDIALIRLDRPVAFNDLAQPACLPSAHMAVATFAPCYVSGWGVTDEKSEAPRGRGSFLPHRASCALLPGAGDAGCAHTCMHMHTPVRLCTEGTRDMGLRPVPAGDRSHGLKL